MQMQSTPHRELIYGAMADKLERDPIGPDGTGRATVVNGRGFAKWRRFHPGEETVWVENPEGQLFELTRTQADVYGLVTASNGSYNGTVRALAILLSRSPSTVSRAVVRLASFGLIAVLTGRGRYGGISVSRRAINDGLDRFRELAKAKVRAWAKAAEQRFSRLQINVVPYLMDRRMGTEVDTLYYYLLSISKNATMTLPWTAEDLADIV
jgi:predicted transcriptional regulator